jgi:hypothetical protein
MVHGAWWDLVLPAELVPWRGGAMTLIQYRYSISRMESQIRDFIT